MGESGWRFDRAWLARRIRLLKSRSFGVALFWLTASFKGVQTSPACRVHTARCYTSLADRRGKRGGDMRWLALNLLTLVAGTVLCSAPAPCWAAAKTCLTGTDPSVTNDLTQIANVRAQIDTQCPCSSFDGSPGKTHATYLRCVKTVITSAVSQYVLRKQCKSTVLKDQSTSACGLDPNQGEAPCITTSASKVKCAVKPLAKCKGAGCPDFTTCIDAADTNDNGLIDPADSGSCVTTPTPTPTPCPSSSVDNGAGVCTPVRMIVEDNFPGFPEFPSWVQKWQNVGVGTTTFDATNPGIAHLNLAGPASSATGDDAELQILPDNLLPPYCDFEVRLRNSNNNGWDAPGAPGIPNPKYGLGSRGWGFWNGSATLSGTMIWFWSLSPDSTPALTGAAFGRHGAGVWVSNGAQVLIQKLDIDMTVWHTYRIQWRKDYIGIFIDNMMSPIAEVADPQLIPSVPLIFDIWTDNEVVMGISPNFNLGSLAIPAINQYIDVDYVKIYQPQ